MVHENGRDRYWRPLPTLSYVPDFLSWPLCMTCACVSHLSHQWALSGNSHISFPNPSCCPSKRWRTWSQIPDSWGGNCLVCTKRVQNVGVPDSCHKCTGNQQDIKCVAATGLIPLPPDLRVQGAGGHSLASWVLTNQDELTSIPMHSTPPVGLPGIGGFHLAPETGLKAVSYEDCGVPAPRCLRRTSYSCIRYTLIYSSMDFVKNVSYIPRSDLMFFSRQRSLNSSAQWPLTSTTNDHYWRLRQPGILSPSQS